MSALRSYPMGHTETRATVSRRGLCSHDHLAWVYHLSSSPGTACDRRLHSARTHAEGDAAIMAALREGKTVRTICTSLRVGPHRVVRMRAQLAQSPGRADLSG